MMKRNARQRKRVRREERNVSLEEKDKARRLMEQASGQTVGGEEEITSFLCNSFPRFAYCFSIMEEYVTVRLSL